MATKQVKISAVSPGDTSAVFETTKDWAVPAEIEIPIKVVKDSIYSSLTDEAIGNKKYLQLLIGKADGTNQTFKNLRIYTDKGILRPISYAKISDNCDDLIAYRKYPNTGYNFKLFDVIFDYTSDFEKGSTSVKTFTDTHSITFDPDKHVRLEIIVPQGYYSDAEMNMFDSNGSWIYAGRSSTIFEIFLLFRNSNIDAANITLINFWNCSYNGYTSYYGTYYITEAHIAMKSTANTVLWEVEALDDAFFSVPTLVDVDCKTPAISTTTYAELEQQFQQQLQQQFQQQFQNRYYMLFTPPSIFGMINLRLFLNNGDILTPMRVSKKNLLSLVTYQTQYPDLDLESLKISDGYSNNLELYEVIYSKNQNETYPTVNTDESYNSTLSLDDSNDYVKLFFLVSEQRFKYLQLKKDASASYNNYMSVLNYSGAPCVMQIIAVDDSRISIDDIGKISMQNDIQNSSNALYSYRYGFVKMNFEKYKNNQKVSECEWDTTGNHLQGKIVTVDTNNATVTDEIAINRFADTTLPEKEQ